MNYGVLFVSCILFMVLIMIYIVNFQFCENSVVLEFFGVIVFLGYFCLEVGVRSLGYKNSLNKNFNVLNFNFTVFLY